MTDQKKIIERAGDSSIPNPGADVSASNRPSHSKPGIIYKVTNLINGKIYIGKTVKCLNHRKQEHLCRSKKGIDHYAFHNAIRKYGVENFKWETIDRCLFHQALEILEKYYIEKFNSKTPNGYNLTDGGPGSCGLIISEESKKKMSIAKIGKPGFWTGKKRARAGVERQREKMIGKLAGEKNPNWGKRGKDSPLFGRKRPEMANRFLGENNPNYGNHSPWTQARRDAESKKHPRKFSESIFMKWEAT